MLGKERVRNQAYSQAGIWPRTYPGSNRAPGGIWTDKSNKSGHSWVSLSGCSLYTTLPWVHRSCLPWVHRSCPVPPCTALPCVHHPVLGTPHCPGYTSAPGTPLRHPWDTSWDTSETPPGSPESLPKAGKPESAKSDKSGDSAVREDAAGRSRPAASQCPVRTAWAQTRSTAWVTSTF